MVIIAVLAFMLLTAAAASAQVQVDTCAQEYSGPGVLVADLDCTSVGGVGVVINGGALDLQGHTLTAEGGVRCNGDVACRVESSVPGGTLQGVAGARSGVSADAGATIEGVTIVGFSRSGVISGGGDIVIRNAVVSGNGHYGAGGIGPNIHVENSTISDNGLAGLAGHRVSVFESTISGNGEDGVEGGTIGIRNSTITDNVVDGVSTFTRVAVFDSVFSGNGRGIFARQAAVRRSDISANLGSGIAVLKKLKLHDVDASSNGLDGVTRIYDFGFGDGRAKIHMSSSRVIGNARFGVGEEAIPVPPAEDGLRIVVASSQVTGNGTDASCGVSQTCADVASRESPRIGASTTCDTSYIVGSGVPGQTWGVCALD